MKVKQEAEDFIVRGAGVLPENLLGVGDGLRFLYSDGDTVTLQVKTERFLKQLAFLHGTDLKALRAAYGEAIGRKQLVPLVFSGEWILVPLKVRIPIGKQSAYGYFISHLIEKVEKANDLQVQITLTGNHQVKVLQSYEFCQTQMRNVTLVRYRYYQIHFREKPAWVKEGHGPDWF